MVGSEYFDVLQKAFNKQYIEASDEWTQDAEMRCVPSLIQGTLKNNHNISVLDLGCGAGYDSTYFASIYDSVIGLDIYDHPQWQLIKNNYKNIDFHCCDFFSFEFNKKFDLILDNGCFHHQDPDYYIKYFEKISSLMKDDSKFVLSTFKNINNSSELKVDVNGRMHKYFSDNELMQLLKKCNLRVFKEIDIFRIKKDNYYRLTFIEKDYCEK